MPLPEKPTRAIFPIFLAREDGSKSFLGTGFFVKEDGTFLTAKHVFDQNPLNKGEYYVIGMFNAKDQLEEFKIGDVEFHDYFDIASGKAKEVKDFVPLKIADRDKHMNQDILCLEYSKTYGREYKGEKHLVVRTAMRKGQIVSTFNENFLSETDELPLQVIELSFPAIKGASGAPIVHELTGDVQGMIVSNVERELISVLGEDKFVAFNGQAISWVHLQDML